MNKSHVLLISISLLYSFSSSAVQNKMKPGLWENTFNMKSESGTVEKAMAELKSKLGSMPEAQRKMMEDIMAKQGLGVNQKGTSIKVCISKEQAENMEIPQGENENCTQEVVNRTANSIKIKFDCKGDNAASGVGEFTFSSPTQYSGLSTINTTLDSKQDKIQMSQTGKWLSSDCGKIKSVTNNK